MNRKTRAWTALGGVALTALALAAVARAQSPEQSISIRLVVPAGARVEFDGTKTASTGESRLYWPKDRDPSILDGTWKPPAVTLAAP